MNKAVILLALALLAPAAVAELPSESFPLGATSIVDGPVHEGHEVTCDLLPQEQFKNIGSRLDGAGMCVFTSIEMAARYQGLEQMRGWRDWCAARYPGGGWPQKVEKLLAAWWQAKGIPPIPYYQYEGPDPEPVLDLIDRTNRMAAIMYNQSPRYAGPRNPSGTIGHMTCCVRFRGEWAAVLDNNFVANRTGGGWHEQNLEWMPRPEQLRRMRVGTGNAWIFCWLTPAPPPPSHLLKPT